MTSPGTELTRGARLLDRYTIVDRVGSGGMATIHRAVDERFDRIVCVKLLRLELEGLASQRGDPSKSPVYSLFVREAVALSKLQHPNTLRIYDFGYLEDGQRPFQVSEFLDGGNLRQHVTARGALSGEETLAILERITGAIAEAHDQNILHRDIKPANILFARVGDVLMPKLADFGIAQTIMARRLRADEVSGEDSDSRLGMFSPRWAAPEQFTGAPEGPYTDVYALGLLTAYMLSGVVPFAGVSPEEAREERARGEEHLRKRMTRMGLSSDVVPVLMRAVAAAPAERTASPTAFFEALNGALGGSRMSLPPREPESKRAKVSPSAGPPPVERRFRVVEAYEKLELELKPPSGPIFRFRVSIIPERDGLFRIQVKGLSCFVAKVGASGAGRPTPAISAAEDGIVEFTSTKRATLGRISFTFGRASGDVGPVGPVGPVGEVSAKRATKTLPVRAVREAGSAAHGRSAYGRVFPLVGGTLVVPFTEAVFAVALDLGPERELIVMSKRA